MQILIKEMFKCIFHKNITSWKIGESDDLDLQNLENETRRVRKGMPAGFLQLETFTLEGTK